MKQAPLTSSRVVEMGPVVKLSPRMLQARVATQQAIAHYDALSGEPAAVAWVAVMDALYELVSTPPAGVAT